MISWQLKLQPNKTQVDKLEDWLWHLEAVWNWAVRKIELDAHDKIFYSHFRFKSLLPGCSKKIGVPSDLIQGVLSSVWQAWHRCFKKISRKPHLKGKRNRLNNLKIPEHIKRVKGHHLSLPGLGIVKYYKQRLPDGRIKEGRISKRASGWYLSIFIETDLVPVLLTNDCQVGIDLGFSNLATLSNGEKIEHPKEFAKYSEHLEQVQRGHNMKLYAKLSEKLTCIQKDRNHKLSRRLVSENALIVCSKDSLTKVSKLFGKAVRGAGHYQLRQMLAYKCSACNRQYIEVDGRYSTMTCSNCGARTGPTGLKGLAVRRWKCEACGAEHDRDVNAAVNTLIAGVGATHERVKQLARTEIPTYQALGGSKPGIRL